MSAGDPEQQPCDSYARAKEGKADLKQLICERIAEGETLASICREAGFPDRSTVARWRDKDSEFDQQLTRAWQLGGLSYAEEAIELSRKTTAETWQADRVTIDTLKWAASKFYPKMFGEASPRSLHQTYVAGDVQVVADESQRKAMIDARQRFLEGRIDSPTHSPRRPSGQAGSGDATAEDSGGQAHWFNDCTGGPTRNPHAVF